MTFHTADFKYRKNAKHSVSIKAVEVLLHMCKCVITYDAIGNPLNDGTRSYTWQAGRQLKQMHNVSTGVTMEFAYGHNGLCTQKVKKVNDVVAETTNYTLHCKLLTHLTKGTDSMHFFYDAQSRPVKVKFNGAMYTYIHNLQGDIVGLLDSNGALAVEYSELLVYHAVTSNQQEVL